MNEVKFRKEVVRLLTSIDLKLAELEEKLKIVMKTSLHTQEKTKTPLDVDVLLSLSDHLRKTAIAVSTRGSATAKEVANDTGRTRAAESDYLNQLVKMGYLSKKRQGRTVYFSI